MPAFQDNHGLVARFSTMPLPVLRATHEGVAHWQQRPDHADAHRLADVVLRDPLMCLRVLIDVSKRLGLRLATPPETVTAALLLMGIEPFFRNFAGAPVLEEHLEGQPAALAGALGAVERAHRAARIAAAFAIHRQDEHAEEIHQAALLHDFSTLLLWCEAPGLASEILRRQAADPLLRSREAQRQVLGADLDAIGHAVARQWRLPSTYDGAPMVMLAVRTARHLDHGWHNPALPDDLIESGMLLNVQPQAAGHLIRVASD